MKRFSPCSSCSRSFRSSSSRARSCSSRSSNSRARIIVCWNIQTSNCNCILFSKDFGSHSAATVSIIRSSSWTILSMNCVGITTIRPLTTRALTTCPWHLVSFYIKTTNYPPDIWPPDNSYPGMALENIAPDDLVRIVWVGLGLLLTWGQVVWILHRGRVVGIHL